MIYLQGELIPVEGLEEGVELDVVLAAGAAPEALLDLAVEKPTEDGRGGRAHAVEELDLGVDNLVEEVGVVLAFKRGLPGPAIKGTEEYIRSRSVFAIYAAWCLLQQRQGYQVTLTASRTPSPRAPTSLPRTRTRPRG